MAMTPCDLHGTRYRGAACHLYPAVMIQNVAVRGHLRVCMLCAKEAIEVLQEHALAPNDEGFFETRDPNTCAACGDAVGSHDVTCFLTAYLPNDERQDYYARYHADCLDPPYRFVVDHQKGEIRSPDAA